jgi:hypothetical protein
MYIIFGFSKFLKKKEEKKMDFYSKLQELFDKIIHSNSINQFQV